MQAGVTWNWVAHIPLKGAGVRMQTGKSHFQSHLFILTIKLLASALKRQSVRFQTINITKDCFARF